MEKINRPRGTQDVLPGESPRWRWLEGKAMATAGAYGYQEIRFPAFEHTELFVRGVGDTTDVVQKEMYTFEDRGGRSITLRPEGTASVVRAGIENGLFGAAMPLKLFYIAPNFRYEKPQAGRLRQHHQFGVECFGASGPEADVEVLALAHSFLTSIGITGLTLHLNSIGCPDCRSAYRDKLLAFLRSKEGLCRPCQERMERNPLRALDCKEPGCRELTQDAPLLRDSLCDDCRSHHEQVQRYLTQYGIPFELDDRIVRGLDYYTRTVFEFITDTIGAQGTVLAGGRYDGLVSALGGSALPGCGFGCGLERLLMVLAAAGVTPDTNPPPQLFIAIADQIWAVRADVIGRVLVNGLRCQGLAVEQDLCGRSLKAQFKHADRIGARYVMTIGSSEVEAASATLKRMSDGHSVSCPLDTEAIEQALSDDCASL